MNTVAGGLVGVIVRAHEDEKLSEEEISSSMGLDLALVKTVLAGNSALYRVSEAAAGREQVYEIVDDKDFSRIKEAYKTLVLSNDTPPNVRERGQRWLLNEKKGRNNGSKLPGLAIGILQINQRLQEIESRRERILNGSDVTVTTP